MELGCDLLFKFYPAQSWNELGVGCVNISNEKQTNIGNDNSNKNVAENQITYYHSLTSKQICVYTDN